MTRQLSIITGCSAGATESFVVVPFELVKIKYARSVLLDTSDNNRPFRRLQDKSLASIYSGPLDVVRQVVRKDGILGLYAGMEATFWRCVDPIIPSEVGETLLILCGVATGTCGGTAVTLDPSSKSRRCFQRQRLVVSLPCV